MFSGHSTDFLSDVLCWGKNHPYWKICRETDVNLSFWCSFDYSDIFPNIVQVIWIKVWMAVTKLTHSKQNVDVCRFVWFSVRSLLCKSFWADSGDFRQKLRCAGCWVKSGEFSSGSKKDNFLGKLKRFSARNLKCAGFWKNRARIGQKIQYTDFKANSGGFRSKTKMSIGFLRKPVRFSVRNLNVQILGQNWGFFGEISTKSEIWMKCSHRSHDGFFRTDFRTFRTFSHDFRTTCFFKVFFRTDFRTFRTVSHDFRTTCFFRVFCSHVSHDLRTQAVGQRVCARFDWNQHKSGENHSFRLAHPKFLNFYKEKPWPIENEHIGMLWIFVQLILC